MVGSRSQDLRTSYSYTEDTEASQSDTENKKTSVRLCDTSV